MAKKKAKATKRTTAKKGYGELFDKHTNLIWLLPIFFIVAVIAVIAIKNASTPPVMSGDNMYENQMMNGDEMNATGSGDEMMMEDDTLGNQ